MKDLNLLPSGYESDVQPIHLTAKNKYIILSFILYIQISNIKSY